MANIIRLITLENSILEVEPDEIEMVKECFFDNTIRPYCNILLKCRGNEDFDKNCLFEVYESKAEIKCRILPVEQRN